MMFSSTVTSVGFLVTLHLIIASKWNYETEGPDVWSDHYPLCAGRSQSPINIRTACTIYQPFPPFKYSPAYNTKQKFSLVNNGHTIVGTYIGKDASPLTLTGGGLNGTYKFVNFHLHSGENYKSGSEHLVNGAKFSGEIHFVHEDATTGEKAVLGMFIRSKSRGNAKQNNTGKVYTPLDGKNYLSLLQKLQKKDGSVVADLNLSWLVSRSLANFWRYAGSLTTPPCTENVIWTLMKEPIVVNEDQFEVIRHAILTKSFRSAQPLYDRIVFQSFPVEDKVSKLDYIACLLQD